MTKSDLIRYLEANRACELALSWLNEQETFGPELIRKCPDVDWLEWLAYRVNPAECKTKVRPLRDEYEAKMDLLWDEYQAKAGPLLDEYEAKLKPLWKGYDAKAKPLRDEYKTKMDHLRDEYDAKAKPLRDEYKTKMDHLRDECDAKMRVALLDILTWEMIEQAVAVDG